jgi:hypothetical protein
LDTTGNVRLLSAEDLALEFPRSPASEAKPGPSWGTSAEARGAGVGGTGTLDPRTMAGGRAGWRPLGATGETAGRSDPGASGEVARADGADDASAVDEVTDVAPASYPAPTTPAAKAPPRTIVIVDESLGSYDADQATTESAATYESTTEQATTDQTTADRGKTDRPTIVIVDDSLIDYEDDQAGIDQASVTEASAGTAADEHTPATAPKPPADASAAHDAAVAQPAVTRWTPEEDAPAAALEDEPPAVEVTAFTDVTPADPAPATYEEVVARIDASLADDTAPTAAPAAAEESSVAAEPADSAGAAEPAEPADLGEPAEPTVSEADLPVPTYDSLSLPSLRSRLRNLDIDQVRMLLAYERTHAARADMITMFERRIEKLASQ